MNRMIKVNQGNTDLLQNFILHLGNASNSFRYFSKRGIEAIDNHLITLLYLHDEAPVGYGHLDKFDNEIWLGIAIIPEFQGKGISHQIMDQLILNAKEFQLESIALTVDNDNFTAIELYLKKGFVEEKKLETYTKYRLNLK
jgi:ribosomal protein S18 acetylase RimI-like enzyme